MRPARADAPAGARARATTPPAVVRPADPAATRRPRRLPRGYESVDSVMLTEPRIDAIRRELQALLEVVQLESGGEPVEIDGFRLRDISRWADYPSSLSDIFWHLSSVCNFDCEFCYEKGNPDGFPIQALPRMATLDEIETRLRHYDARRRTGIFTVRTAINEPFANRGALEVLRQMRAQHPDELISFVTNGSFLSEDVVRELAELQPLFFNFSIYSTDPEVRRRVIRDRKPDRAVRAVDLLHRYRIPYMTNLVMWPSIPFEDMRRTIDFMAERGAAVLRVCLGGYSRYLEGDFERFRAEAYWPRVVAEVERIRASYAMPLLIEPNSFVRQDTDAVVDGTIAGSPAARAGLRYGDRIVAVNGRPVASRMQLLAVLRRLDGAGGSYRPPGVASMSSAAESDAGERVQLELERDGRALEVVLERFEAAAMTSYPYAQIAGFRDFMYGLVITDCLRYASLAAARDAILERGARHVLLLTSMMIEPMLRHMLDRSGAFDGLDVAIRVARNEYFGGSINIGDLLVVDDFVAAVRRYCAEGGRRPDLVLIPASPFASSPWGRDLAGRPWLELERAVGVPVELVPCHNITY